MLKRPVNTGRFLFLGMTTEEDIEKLKFPIGEFQIPENVSVEDIRKYTDELARLPQALVDEVQDLDQDQLQTAYRPEGWTIRQLVHHLSDSHMNAFMRFKWALTEDEPTIKAYNEKRFADLADSQFTPVSLSLSFLKALHGRWVILLENMSTEDFERTFVHPESGFRYTLKQSLANYAWHGRHHLQHIKDIKKRKGWD